VEWANKVAAAEALYTAFNRRDMEAALAQIREDAVADWSRSRGPHAGFYSGREGLRELIESFWEPWSELEFRTKEFLPAAEGLVRVGGFRAVGRGSGIVIEAEGAQLIQWQDGLISRLTLFQSAEDALAAAEGDGPA
jgi:ketosteroid isomerase-like protein